MVRRDWLWSTPERHSPELKNDSDLLLERGRQDFRTSKGIVLTVSQMPRKRDSQKKDKSGTPPPPKKKN